jgi:hypothetical protein
MNSRTLEEKFSPQSVMALTATLGNDEKGRGAPPFLM